MAGTDDEQFIVDAPVEDIPNYFTPRSVPVSDVPDLAKYTTASEFISRTVYSGPYSIKFVDYVGRSTYPDNHATLTDTGHKFELDDSHGSERVNLEHRTGTKVEMLPNGDLVQRVSGDAYEIVASDKNVIIRGHCNVTIEGSSVVHVRGDYELNVDGDFNLNVSGDRNEHTLGSVYARVEQNHEEQIVGSELHEVRGNTIERYWENRTTRVLGYETIELGGSYKITTEGSFTAISYGALSASFFGGELNLNGLDAEGTVGEGAIIVEDVFLTNAHGSNVYLDTSLHAPAIVASTVDADTFEGLAKKATFAVQATLAGGTGTVTPTTPSPDNPTEPTAPTAATVEVADVTGTSRSFIINLDRSSITEMNISKLDFAEAQRRLRNRALLTNSKFLSDLVATEAILSSVSSQDYKIVKEVTYTRPKEIVRLNESVPSWFKSEDEPTRRTQLSPNFYAAHLMHRARLIPQIGLTTKQITSNMRLMSMNVLEMLKFRFKDSWWISEGLYNPYSDENLDSLALSFAKGLGIAIQFPYADRDVYTSAVKSIIEDAMIPYDKLVLSYIDYDPYEQNEPSIILTLSAKPQREFYTEFNHVKIDSRILEL